MAKKFTHRLMKLEDGRWTTVHKDNMKDFPNAKFGPESRGAARWDIEEALGIEKYGQAYIDIPGNYEGQIAMTNLEGRTHVVPKEKVDFHLKAGHKLGDKKNLQL